MSNIENIDKNFKIETKIDKPDIEFHSARSAPFRIYGVFHQDGKFRRMPEEVAKKVSPGVHFLHANTAGGRVRFMTNSPYVAISAKMTGITRMDHFPLCGSAGFDLYADGVYVKTFRPPYYMEDGYESIIELGEAKMREIIIHFPLYSDVCELFIGLARESEILASPTYRVEKPVVFYGSSVTQGGCASRPGTCYQGFLSRWLDFDYINLGFSGNARGEDEMADYIASLDMSAFVCDYDYNTPSAEHLEKTHEKLFMKVRMAHPDLPIILVTRPKPIYTKGEDLDCLEVIRKTYENALARGDKKVSFIDGRTMFALAGTEGTVDSVHPTDLGFLSMAERIREDLNTFL